MNYLLNTHTLVWAIAATRELSPLARNIILNKANRIFVSSASAWELSTKVRVGRWRNGETVEKSLMASVDMIGFDWTPITPEVALLAGRLAGAHRDPFDRMIAAHALTDGMPVISVDKKLDTFSVRRIW